jgi:hypothetical protein
MREERLVGRDASSWRLTLGVYRYVWIQVQDVKDVHKDGKDGLFGSRWRNDTVGLGTETNVASDGHCR